MKKILHILGFSLLLGCSSAGTEEGSDLIGSYSCSDCVYQEIILKESGEAMMKAQELEMPASYIIEGNKVVISIETAEYTFVKQPDGTLEGQGDVPGIYSK